MCAVGFDHSPGGRGGPCAVRTRRWCRVTNRSKIDLADRASDRFAAEVQPIERRTGQKLMQAGLLGRAEAVEFIRSYHHHRVAAMHRHPLWLTRGGEPDDLAEPRLGFPQLPAGKRRPSRGTCRSFRHLARPSDQLGRNLRGTSGDRQVYGRSLVCEHWLTAMRAGPGSGPSGAGSPGPAGTTRRRPAAVRGRDGGSRSPPRASPRGTPAAPADRANAPWPRS